MIKIGLVGVGHLGKIHLSQIKYLSDVYHLVGFYDSNEEVRQQIAQTHGITAFDSVEQLIEASDALDIVTPTVTHFEIAKKALQHTKPIFIEKPITRTSQEAEFLVKLAEEAGVTVQVGHVERFNPAFLALKEVTLKPSFIEVHRLAQWNPRGTDVSVVLDLMIHDIDIVLRIVNSEVRRISANGVAVISTTPDIANARIEFTNGCVANLTASRISMKNMRKMRIFQPHAYVSVDFLDKKTEIFSISDTAPEIPLFQFTVGDETKYLAVSQPEVPEVNAIREELLSFAQAIETKSDPPVTILDALKSIRVAQEIMERIMPE